MRTQKQIVQEDGVTYDYEKITYEASDLPAIEAEAWTDDERSKWLIAVLRKQAAADREARIAAIYEGTYEEHKDAKDIGQRMTLLRLLVKEIISLADYDKDLEICGPKMIDSVFTRGFEKLRDNLREAYRATQAELRAMERFDDSTEIPGVGMAELHRKLVGMAKQGRFFGACFEACLDVRPEIIAASGINWSSYMTLKQMASQRNQKRRMIDAARDAEKALAPTAGMSESEYRVYLAKQHGYVPQTNGTAYDDGKGPGAAAVADFLVEKEARLRNEAEHDKKLDAAAGRTSKKKPRSVKVLRQLIELRAAIDAETPLVQADDVTDDQDIAGQHLDQ